ncbi:hypothetical protein KSD_87470 [Ktedonobacter sp. SOSP1-85]|nr:hypothetical protein KSD_87470 [Ktedonobacter sp. SOSP1-85]
MIGVDFFHGFSTSVEVAPNTKLTLECVREQEQVSASLADMAADIVAGKQQVALDLRRSFTVEQFAPDGE